MYFTRSVLATIALGSTLLRSNAQVTTSCNPLDRVCPNDKGLATSSYSIDFTSLTELPAEWVVAKETKVVLGKNGAELTFNKRYDAPTMWLDPKFFFGRVEYVVKAAPGTGIISSMVLLSSDLDEVDWEFRGGITDSVQTNYFGKGYTGTYNRSTTESIKSPQETFHTYAVDWSPSSLTWSIDGKNVRTLNAAEADGAGSQYPQTPMRVSLSLWDGGDPDTNPGTVQWAGGYTPLPPPTPYTMYVKSVKVWNSAPAQQYQYTDKSGAWTSIKIVNETMTASSSTSMEKTQTLSLAPTATSSNGSMGTTSPLTTTTSPVSSQKSTYPTTAPGNMTAMSASVSASSGLPTGLPGQAAGAPFPNTTTTQTSVPTMTAASNATISAPYLNATSSRSNRTAAINGTAPAPYLNNTSTCTSTATKKMSHMPPPTTTAAPNATTLPSAFTPSPTASAGSLPASSPTVTPQASSQPTSQPLAVTTVAIVDTLVASTVSSLLSNVSSGTYVQQPPTSTSAYVTMPSQAANTSTTPPVSGPSSSVLSESYVQQPPTSTSAYVTVSSQAAASPSPSAGNSSASGTVASSSPVGPTTVTVTSPAAVASSSPVAPTTVTVTSPAAVAPSSPVSISTVTVTTTVPTTVASAAPTQNSEPGKNTSDAANKGGSGSTTAAGSDAVTILPPSPSSNPSAGVFVNADDGAAIVSIPSNVTSTVGGDSITTTVTTSRTLTSTVTVTNAPYPYPNGSYVSMKGSGTVASTGGFGTGSGFLPIPTGSAYLRGTAVGSGYVRGTATPPPYSTGAASKVGMRWGTAVVAGTMAGLWSVL